MLLDSARGYDLIGDVHGCVHTLRELLDRLGYRYRSGVWQHPWRMALFLGDIVDRGPGIREVLHLVHDMEEAGQARCVMGNHEYDVLGWHTRAPAGAPREYVRAHSDRNAKIIGETLEQFVGHPKDWQDFIAWFYRMPLLLDGGGFRVVHACWDSEVIQPLLARFPTAQVDEAFVAESVFPDSLAFRTLDRLLRGTGLRLPNGRTLTGRDGFVRSVFRTKFWEEAPRTLGDVVFQPDGLPEDVIDLPLETHHRRELLYYGADQPPLFIGHYWRQGTPTPIRDNLACLDYSAVLGGKLVAYRYDGESRLDANRFVWVNVAQSDAARPRGAS